MTAHPPNASRDTDARQTTNTPLDPIGTFPPYVNYAHAVEVRAGSRTLYVSGLNGFEEDGITMPGSFTEQAELVWHHLTRALAAADMTYADLVSLRFYLPDPGDDPDNVAILRRHLGDLRAARTVVCAQLLDPRWRIELEAVAARCD